MTKLVRVVPTGTAFINGVPAVPQDVPEDVALVWAAMTPAPFTIEAIPQTGAGEQEAKRPGRVSPVEADR